MCDNRELERLREQRDDAIARAETWREHSVRLNSIGWALAVAVGDVGPDDTEVESDPEGRLVRLIGRLDAVLALCDWTQHPEIPVAPYAFVDMVRAAATGETA